MDDLYCVVYGVECYMDFGVIKGMGEVMFCGMVFVFSVWWDEGGYMEWFDFDYVGFCKEGEGVFFVICDMQFDIFVIFSNIRWGEIDLIYELWDKCKCRVIKYRI